MFENLFQGVGIFVCVGAILLVLLAVFAARKAFGAGKPPRMDRDDQRVWEERGRERPRYDSDRVESSGGFGRTSSGPRQDREGGLGGRRSGLDRDRDPDDQPRSRRLRDDDRDDDVRSSGGFGGSG